MRGEREIGPRRPGLVRPGQRPLRRFDFADFVAAGVAVPETPMPTNRVSIDGDGAVELKCDCGALPHRLPPALSVICECKRFFVHIGRGEVRGCRIPEEALADA
jgi:hypothetical protein